MEDSLALGPPLLCDLPFVASEKLADGGCMRFDLSPFPPPGAVAATWLGWRGGGFLCPLFPFRIAIGSRFDPPSLALLCALVGSPSSEG